MSYGYGYDSVEGRATVARLRRSLTGEAYEQAREWRRRMDAFPGYKDARCSGVSKPVAKDNVASMLKSSSCIAAAVSEIPGCR